MKAPPHSNDDRNVRDDFVYSDFNEFCWGHGLKIPHCDTQSHDVAMKLFEEQKPDYYECNGSIVHARPKCTDEGFERTVMPMPEFLAQVAQDQARLEKLEWWFAVVADSLVFLLGLVFVVQFGVLTNGILADWFVLVVIMIGGGFTWRWFFVTRPKKLAERKRTELEIQLAELRKKLGRSDSTSS